MQQVHIARWPRVWIWFQLQTEIWFSKHTLTYCSLVWWHTRLVTISFNCIGIFCFKTTHRPVVTYMWLLCCSGLLITFWCFQAFFCIKNALRPCIWRGDVRTHDWWRYTVPAGFLLCLIADGGWCMYHRTRSMNALRCVLLRSTHLNMNSLICLTTIHQFWGAEAETGAILRWLRRLQIL